MHPLFPWIAAIALLAAGLIILALVRLCNAEQQRANAAETKAAMSYGKGYRDATDEINHRRDHEDRRSFQKGHTRGWNDCVEEYEERQEPKNVAAA